MLFSYTCSWIIYEKEAFLICFCIYDSTIANPKTFEDVAINKHRIRKTSFLS